MRIQGLSDKWKGEDVYVVGTGPSLRLFPPLFFDGRRTIGLNQAWKSVPVDYSLTVHPELVLEYRENRQKFTKSRTRWVVKKKQPLADISFDDPEHYVFWTKEDLALVSERVKDYLYLGRGIQCTAINLAVLMGARTIYMAGVDMCALGEDHHSHEQHVQFHGLAAADVYEEYRVWTARVASLVRDKFGVSVVTLSPFLGLNSAEDEYVRLCGELKLPKLAKPKDISTYTRKKADV